MFLMSNVSTWLGTPPRNRKITFLAVSFVSMVPSESVSGGLALPARKKAPRLVYESRNKQRLVWS